MDRNKITNRDIKGKFQQYISKCYFPEFLNYESEENVYSLSKYSKCSFALWASYKQLN